MKKKKKSKFFSLLIKISILTAFVFLIASVSSKEVYASDVEVVSETSTDESNKFTIGITAGNGSDLASVLQIVLVLTVIALAPSILIMLTSFTRLVIVMHFTRNALGTQSAPPNQVLIGLSLFLTFFIMAPTFTKVYNEAIKPMSQNEITAEEAYNVGIEPIREFMFEQTNTKDIKLFLNIANIEDVENMNDIPTNILIPSFIVSELRTAFIIGFLIYIPFIVIDMVVASALMSMGMMMLPPTTISMPFKILLFILADGWNLIIGNVVKTFY